MPQGKIKAGKKKTLNGKVKKNKDTTIKRKWQPTKLDLGKMNESDRIAVQVKQKISGKTTRGLEKHIVEKMRVVQDKMFLTH